MNHKFATIRIRSSVDKITLTTGQVTRQLVLIKPVFRPLTLEPMRNCDHAIQNQHPTSNIVNRFLK